MLAKKDSQELGKGFQQAIQALQYISEEDVNGEVYSGDNGLYADTIPTTIYARQVLDKIAKSVGCESLEELLDIFGE